MEHPIIDLFNALTQCLHGTIVTWLYLYINLCCRHNYGQIFFDIFPLSVLMGAHVEPVSQHKRPKWSLGEHHHFCTLSV